MMKNAVYRCGHKWQVFANPVTYYNFTIQKFSPTAFSMWSGLTGQTF